jgi:hypothetical protein
MVRTPDEGLTFVKIWGVSQNSSQEYRDHTLEYVLVYWCSVNGPDPPF